MTVCVVRCIVCNSVLTRFAIIIITRYKILATGHFLAFSALIYEQNGVRYLGCHVNLGKASNMTPVLNGCFASHNRSWTVTVRFCPYLSSIQSDRSNNIFHLFYWPISYRTVVVWVFERWSPNLVNAN